MRGVFVTGTDTGVGKTALAASIAAAAGQGGLTVASLKPVVTGLDEEMGEWPPDHELLAAVSNVGQSPEEVAPFRYGPAVSPHLAAQFGGIDLDPDELVELAHALA